jgi:alpha-mannosidase
MQAHIPEERKILIEQVELQIKAFWDRRIVRCTPIEGWEIAVTGNRQLPSRGPKTGWEPYRIGDHWGEDKPDWTAWFRAKVKVPKEFVAQGTFVELGLAPSREALAFFNGVPMQGLSVYHTSIRLNRTEHLRRPINLLIEAYTEFPRNPPPPYDGRFRFAEIRQIDRAVYDIHNDLLAAVETVKVLDPASQSFQKLLDLLSEVLKATRPLPEENSLLRKNVTKVAKTLRAGLAKLPSEPGRGKLLLVGHSHIDTAWLWPLRETRRKVGRTFATVLSLMESYPEYTFQQSQPQLYQYTKEHYPEIYAGIKKRIKEGRWDPAGAPWVEMDSILSGGEALVRQMLYGNLFLEKEFGIRSKVCWLPDAFGYNWNLPQILKKSGIDIFVTTKIDWSEVTKFPYTIFNWEGADGSKVVGLMPPLNYNGLMKTKDLRDHWDRVGQKNLMEELVYSFGWGDGGGGPTQEMIEMGKRMADITGIPKCRFGTVTQYCDELLESLDPSRLPVWNGELYLEMHRGCQTTQARTKWDNRKMEVLLRDAEVFASLAFLHGVRYPAAQLLPAWQETLTSQFHDILPGSSVNEVYEEAGETNGRARAAATGVQTSAQQSLAKRIDTHGEGDPIILFNTLGWDRLDPVSVQLKLPRARFHLEDGQGNPVSHQVVAGEGKGKSLLVSPASIPSMGHTVVLLLPGAAGSKTPSGLKAAKNLLENEFFRITLDGKGTLSRIFDKRAKRDVLAGGARGNVLQLFHDEPHLADAWDFDFNFEENLWEWEDVQSIEVVEEGPLRAGLRVIRKTAKSTLVQRILIYRDVPRIDFETTVDWHEKRVLLKAAFPVAVRSRNATYEIQFGAIDRPTHRNTPFERARFEYPHLRWADLSEGGYGVALANDSKYGIDTVENVLRLSLLRAPTEPDPKADEGHHRFTYSLIPHFGDFRDGEVVRRATELNIPAHGIPATKHSGEIPSEHSWVTCDAPHVVLEALKKEERGQALILRLYESNGSRGPATVQFGFPVSKVFECNLMEEDDKPVRMARNSVKLDMKPFEIRTLKISS